MFIKNIDDADTNECDQNGNEKPGDELITGDGDIVIKESATDMKDRNKTDQKIKNPRQGEFEIFFNDAGKETNGKPDTSPGHPDEILFPKGKNNRTKDDNSEKKGNRRTTFGAKTSDTIHVFLR